jgi:hypothetical protein
LLRAQNALAMTMLMDFEKAWQCSSSRMRQIDELHEEQVGC